MQDDETTTAPGPGDDQPRDTTPLFGAPRSTADRAARQSASEGATLVDDPTEAIDVHDDVVDTADVDDTSVIPPVSDRPRIPDGTLADGTHADGALPLDPDDQLLDGDEEPRRRRWLLAAVPLVLLLGLGAWVGSLFDARAGQAMPGVTVEDFDAGGMTGDQIATRLTDVVDARRNAIVTVRAADQSWDYQLGEDGYTADVDATVDRALSAGRDGPIASVVTHIAASRGRTSWDIELDGVNVDRDVDTFLADINDAVDLEPTAGLVDLDPETLEVTAELPQEGFDAKVEDARDDLIDLLGTGESADVTVPVDTLPPLVDPANVEATVERARAVLAESYVLASGDDTLTIDPSEIAPALSIIEVDEGYDVALDRDAVADVLADGRGDRFDVSPVSATYRVNSGYRTFDDKGSATFNPSPANVELIEGRNGREFNPEVATELLVSLFDAGEHRGEFELDVVEANFTNDEARAAQPDALLGTFTTYHAAGGARVFNIHLLADMIDGELLPPGDDFSVNRDIGDRTEAKGFQAAGAIKNGEIIDDDIGGGVSQLATTFYNAAFFAGIDVLSWQPHSLPISRYPLAREATFSYAGGLDIHILNNTQGALVVKTSYTSTSITVSIFGKDDGRSVSAVMGQPRDYKGFDVERRTTDELPAGQTRTVQTGGEGFSVDYQRIIEGGSRPGTENFSWTYSPKPTIIETGTG